MKKSVQAALLSALVFPGAGHFMLKKPLPGTAFLALFLVGLAFFTLHEVQLAMVLVDKIRNGQLAPDPLAIAAFLSAPSEAENFPSSALGLYLMLASWVGSMADAYRVGRKADQPNS